MKNERKLFMNTVKIGPKGQIVIPKEVREMLGVEPGDSVLLMADSTRGVALQKPSLAMAMAKQLMGDGQHFADAVDEAMQSAEVTKDA